VPVGKREEGTEKENHGPEKHKRRGGGTKNAKGKEWHPQISWIGGDRRNIEKITYEAREALQERGDWWRATGGREVRTLANRRASVKGLPSFIRKNRRGGASGRRGTI